MFTKPVRALGVAMLLLLGQGPVLRAYEVRTIAHVSQDELKKKCDAAGGKYEVVLDQYSCAKNGNTVVCDKKQCTSVTKDAVRPKKLHELKPQDQRAAPVGDMPMFQPGSQRANPMRDLPVLQ